MNKLVINLEAMYHNLVTIHNWMEEQNARWTVVTKVLCGHVETLEALVMCGVRSIGESRLKNLISFKEYLPNLETWYLRIPSMSAIEEIVEHANITLNSEMDIIEALNKEAGKKDIVHRVVIMIELGDLREGILPSSLIKFYRHIFEMSNVNVIGIGANLGCLAGAVPNVDQFVQLQLYKELLELKFDMKMPIISAGSTATLPLVIDKTLPKGINHFRIGEGVFLGTDLINGGTLPNLRNDTVILKGEIIEIKKKSLLAQVETGNSTPFDSSGEQEEYEPGQRGYRALINIGQLDTNVKGLIPQNPSYRVAGASSDITVVNVGENPSGLKIGGTIDFRLDYAALLGLMSSEYVEKEVAPAIDEFAEIVRREGKLSIPLPLE
jgi:predicted amino acid racemase